MTTQRGLVPRARPFFIPGEDARDPRTDGKNSAQSANGDTATQARRENWKQTQDTVRGTITSFWPRGITNVRPALQLLNTRTVLAPSNPLGARRVLARRRGPGAHANGLHEHVLARAGQAPELRGGETWRGDERP